MTANVAASVRARLRNKMHDTGLEFQFLLARYACERFLYRLGASPMRDRCILKGASLLTVWMDEPYRATRDVDVLALDGADEAYVRQVVATICGVPCPEDALTFDLSSVRVFPIRAAQDQPNQRVTLTARLGNARIPLQVDVGFGDVVVPGPEEVRYPTLLDGMAGPAVRAYPRASSVAEKFEAIVQLGQQNSRMKDFHDVWALSETFSFDGTVLREAIRACFARRGTDWTTLKPVILTSKFYSNVRLIRLWRDYRSSTEPLIPPPEAFEVVSERIFHFLGPIRDSVLADAPFGAYWPPGGPWANRTAMSRTTERATTQPLPPANTRTTSLTSVARHRPYPDYEDSDFQWLKEIPAHWKVERLKYVATVNDETLSESTDPNFTMEYIDIGSVDAVAGIIGTETLSFEGSPSRARRVVRHGDVIVSTVRTYLKAIAPIEDPPTNTIVSTGFAVVRPEGIGSRFASYVLRSPYFVELVVANSVGVGYPAINAADLGCLPIALPTMAEQRIIAIFLDRETAKIDALVAKKERLIELLEEKRTVLITHAITKGLSSDVPRKDTGIPWFGGVPEHWDIVRLSDSVTRFVDYRGKTPKKSSFGVPLVTAKNIKNLIIDFSDSREYISEDLYPSWMVRGLPELGDVVVTTEAPLGEAAQISDTRVALAQRLILLKPDSKMLYGDYLKYHFASDSGRRELHTRVYWIDCERREISTSEIKFDRDSTDQGTIRVYSIPR